MAYIGREPTNTGEFLLIDDISGDFNGSTDTFTLRVGTSEITPAAANTIIVLDGVLQEPSSSYRISGSTIIFSEAPQSSIGFYGVLAGQSQYIANSSITDDHISGTANISGSKISTDFSDRNFILNHITASGDVSASGTVYASNFESAGASGETISFNDDLDITGHITASGNISASGNIYGTNITASAGFNASDIRIDDYIYHNDDPDTYIGFPTGDKVDIKAGNILFIRAWQKDSDTDKLWFNPNKEIVNTRFYTNTNSPGLQISASGNVGIHGIQNPSASLHIGGNLLVESHITASGNISSSGNIIATGNLDIDGSADFASNITASGNISSSASVIAKDFSGTFIGALSSSAQEATSISGSFSKEHLAAKVANVVTSSAQLATDISGSFSKEHLAAKVANVVTSSAQISTDISGSFVAPSASFSSRTTTLEGTGTIQGVGQSDAVTFATVNTGQGANELYDMDQNVKTDSDVTFANATIAGTLSAQEIHTRFVSASVTLATGSNQFGDALTDVQNFTGSVNMSSSLSVFGHPTEKTLISGSSVSASSAQFSTAQVDEFTGNLTIPDSILHTGDTNTMLQFGTDEVKLRTGGSSRLIARDANVELYVPLISESNISSSASSTGSFGNLIVAGGQGAVGIGIKNPADYDGRNATNLVVGATSGNTGITIVSATDSQGQLVFADGTSSDAAYRGRIWFDHAAEGLYFTGGGGTGTNFVIDTNSRISLSNNDNNTSNTVFGKSAFNAGSDNGSDYNAVFGESAMGNGSVAGANENAAFGRNAFRDATSGDNNVFVGSATGIQSTTIIGATAVGRDALGGVTTTGANYTTAIGFAALNALTSGEHNVAIGYKALQHTDTGTDNIAIGYQALGDQDVGGSGHAADSDKNIAIGTNAMGGAWADAKSEFNVAIGFHSMLGSMNGAGYNTAIGTYSMESITTGDDNVALGYGSGQALSTGNENVMLGYFAGSGSVDIDRAVIIGRSAGQKASDSNNDGLVAIGYAAAGATTSGTGNVAVGYSALGDATTVHESTALGYQAMSTHGTGNSNTAIGYQAMADTNAGSTSAGSTDNVFIGKTAGGGTWADAASNYNIGIGNSVMSAILSGALSNVAIGYGAFAAATQGDDNVAIGHGAMNNATTSGKTIAIGRDAAANLAAGTDGCIAIGYQALDAAVDSAHYTVAIGQSALGALTTGASNIGIGYRAGTAVTTGAHNTVIGYDAFFRATTLADKNVVIGSNAMSGNFTTNDVDGCIVIGYDAGSGALTNDASGSVFIGMQAGKSVTSGASNTAIGYLAFDACGTGGNNTIIGAQAGTSLPDGANSNTAVGAKALYDGNNSGTDKNTCIGNEAGLQIQAGSQNTLIGYKADVDTSNYTNTTVVGCEFEAAASNAAYFGNPSTTAFYRRTAGTGTANNFYMDMYNSNAADGPIFFMRVSKHSTLGNLSGGAGSGDTIGQIWFQGSDGNSFETAAAIKVEVDASSADGDMPGRMLFMTTEDGASSPTERVRIDNSGRVQIGTAATTLAARLVASGSNSGGNFQNSIAEIGNSNDGSTLVVRTNKPDAHDDRGPFQIYQSGTHMLETRNTGLLSGDFNDTSDRDLKENITSMTSSLSALNNLNPVTFTWKWDEATGEGRGAGETNLGFIAQEVQEKFPQLVSGTAIADSGSAGLSLNTIGITSVITKAVQDLTKEIQFLRAAITGSTDINQLKALVSGSTFV